MSEHDERVGITRDLLREAFPLSGAHYVTRDEFNAALAHIDVKIANSALRLKLWILGGVVAILLSVFTSYAALVSKIDRLSETLPQIATVQAGRTKWIQQQERRDGMQDEALRKLDKGYQPLPYEAPPQ